MHEQEKRIKEQRTVEANKKNLMGFDGKIGCIVRNMGQPLVSQSRGGTYFSSTPGFDFFDIPTDNLPGELSPGTPEEITQQLPVIDIDGVEQPEGGIWMDRPATILENTEKLGWYFDGLIRGMHLEIKYMDENKELTVNYKGYCVYRELTGDLEAYIPLKEWEDMIDRLYNVARKIRVVHHKNEKEERKQELKRAKETWLQKMKNKWGL